MQVRLAKSGRRVGSRRTMQRRKGAELAPGSRGREDRAPSWPLAYDAAKNSPRVGAETRGKQRKRLRLVGFTRKKTKWGRFLCGGGAGAPTRCRFSAAGTPVHQVGADSLQQTRLKSNSKRIPCAASDEPARSLPLGADGTRDGRLVRANGDRGPSRCLGPGRQPHLRS